MSTEWIVHEHGPLQEIGPGLWSVQGTIPKQTLGRSMVVLRSERGELIVHNPICLDEASMAALAQHGEIRWIIVPCPYHRLDVGRFAARFPEAKILAPKGARKRVSAKVTVHGECEDLPFETGVILQELRGTQGAECVLRIEGRGPAVVVLADAVFNLPHSGGLSGWLVRLMGSSGGPKVTPLGKFIIAKDKKAFTEHLRELADIPNLGRVIVAHREPITEQPGDVLRQVAADL